MSVAIYLDEHVKRAVLRALRSREVDVLTVQEDRFAGRSDTQILDRAQALGRVVFTQDSDFLIEACSRQRAGRSFSGVLYARRAGVTVGRIVEDLELIAKVSSLEEFQDRVVYIPMEA
jgi:hypothetical protein